MKRIWLGVALVLGAHGQALAWGPEGHAIVAEIAERHLSEKARTSIAAILGPGVSLASVASWADDVRGNRPETYNWHFVDIPLAADRYDAARDCKPDAAKGDCIIAAVARLRREVATKRTPAQKRREALRFLVHFIGDLHQPLHTLLEEKGGNGVPVKFFRQPNSAFGAAPKENTNLHVVWDSGLIRHCVWSWNAYVDRLQYDWLPGKDLTALARGTPVQWAEEAHKAARDVAFTVAKGADLGDDYVARAVPVLDRQLAVAGLRLARVLNEAFGAGPRPYRASVRRDTSYGWYCTPKAEAASVSSGDPAADQ
jgi:hypothetical protein